MKVEMTLRDEIEYKRNLEENQECKQSSIGHRGKNYLKWALEDAFLKYKQKSMEIFFYTEDWYNGLYTRFYTIKKTFFNLIKKRVLDLSKEVYYDYHTHITYRSSILKYLSENGFKPAKEVEKVYDAAGKFIGEKYVIVMK